MLNRLSEIYLPFCAGKINRPILIILNLKEMRTLIFISCFLTSLIVHANKNEVSLNGNSWTLYYGLCDSDAPTSPEDLSKSDWPSVSATVPGNVEMDLLAAGLIEDPELGNNINYLRKYEAYRWWYVREFDSPAVAKGERVDIIFGGIDCLATIWINGQIIGETKNMLIDHRFDITDFLKSSGKNQIYVRIDPIVPASQKYISAAVGNRMLHRCEYQHMRKASSMYGWDIMPRLISAGLWRDVSLEIKKTSRIDHVYWQTNQVDVNEGTAQVLVDFQVYSNYATIDGLNMEVSLNRKGKNVFKKSYPLYTYCKRYSIDLENVDYWWPSGYGDAALYDATLRLVDDKGKVLDEKSQKVGIRTIKLVRSEVVTDDKPGVFEFIVNGEKIFIKGTNWVPLDAFHSRDKQHVKPAMDMIIDMNCNMIRCWGGNVYEDHPFFDICDENGIMVWQDFSFAGTPYSQDPEFLEEVRKEANNIVQKLRVHPSLALWCGNNEIDYYFVKMYKKAIDPRFDKISREVLPTAVWEFDPVRDYLPSSPYVSPECFKYQQEGLNFSAMPQVHLWGVRGYYKTPFYTDQRSVFVSEIGYHGCPNRESIEKMFDKDYVYPWTSGWTWNDQWQTKAAKPHPVSTGYDERNDLMINQEKILFGECPKDLDKFIFGSQVVQAEAMKYFVELWRMRKFDKGTGIIWWNLRDGWPIISDAVVDYYNSKKLGYYYIKQVQHDACVMIGDAKEGKHPVVAVNDTREAKSGTVKVSDIDSKKVLFTASFDIPVNGKTTIGFLPEVEGQTMWLIEYTIGEEKLTNHYLVGKAPFNMDDYQRWYKKLGIKRD